MRIHDAMMAILALFMTAAATTSTAAQSADRFVLQPDDHVVITGNTFADRIARHGYLTALIHAAHPEHNIVVRNIPWEADELTTQPREVNVPSTFDNLARLEADVVFMFHGMTESFKGREHLAEFEQNLRTAIADTREGLFNGASEARIILVTPIAHEDLGHPHLTGDSLAQRNAVVNDYAQTMRNVAAELNVRCVDLTTVSRQLAQGHTRPLTTNGIHPNEYGACYITEEIGRQLGWLTPGNPTASDIQNAEALRSLAWNAFYHEKLRYHPTNTEYVWGRRHKPFGIVNFPPEIEQLDRMINARDQAMWDAPKPGPAALFARAPQLPELWEAIPDSSLLPDDNWTPQTVEAKGTETSLGSLEILPPDQFAEAITVAPGYVIECFASEIDFPALKNPLAMNFDNRGRLWVMCAETYPHLLPGEQPTCSIIILDDTDNDGKADTQTTFIDDLYIPTGFAIDNDGVYVGQAPDLFFLQDTNNDGVCDRRHLVASGFGMPDSHHTVSAFEWDPLGGILFHEGVFTITGVETPHGLRRTRDAAVWRLDPRTRHLTTLSHCGFANPWGHAFDNYGQSVMADASGGDNFSFSHIITAFDWPTKPKRPGPILNRGRPTAGCEIVLSRHFPDDVQGSFLVNQSIGFHGVRWDQLNPDGSSWSATRMPEDLVSSSDTNFRPVAMEIGPDGALYLADWCNPIIGHMQYSVRDPRRDHTHGRIWRVRHETRPLLQQPEIANASIPQLLELLRLPERNTRQHARRRLQTMETSLTLPALISWAAQLEESDPLHDRLTLESLWIHHAHGRYDAELLDQVCSLNDPRCRAAGVRVIRHWLQENIVDDAFALPRLEQAVNDDDMRVRLEAVIACGFIESADGIAIAELAAAAPLDGAMQTVLDATIAHLSKYGEATSDIVRRMQAQRKPLGELLADAEDPINAYAILTSTQASMDQRRAAIDTLAQTQDNSTAQQLIVEISQPNIGEQAIEAIAPVALEQAGPMTNAHRGELASIAANRNHRAQHLALALLLIADDNAAEQHTPLDVAQALAVLPAQRGPSQHVQQLRNAIDAHEIEPGIAMPQVIRHAPHDDELVNWLTQTIDQSASKTFDQWNEEHNAALAALRALHDLHESEWPGNLNDYRLQLPAANSMNKGHDLYHDEIVGCARCHGDQGQGTDGIPPLYQSPWVLGNPERAAAIVIKGLFGPLQFHDGSRFESAMEPLGEVLDDAQISHILNYVRNSWGNVASMMTETEVMRAREKSSETGMWSTDQIQSVYPMNHDRFAVRNVNLTNADSITDPSNGTAPNQSDNATNATNNTGGNPMASGAVLSVIVCFIPIIGFTVFMIFAGFKQTD